MLDGKQQKEKIKMSNKITIETNCLPNFQCEEFGSGIVPASGQPPVRIDISAIPDSDFEVACAVLASSIRLALRNPEKRKDYERWRAERTAKATGKKERSGRV